MITQDRTIFDDLAPVQPQKKLSDVLSQLIFEHTKKSLYTSVDLFSGCDAIETDYDWMIVGRYELYPTGNNYNFILIDTIFGRSYQVQWSTESNQCGKWRIW